jgi:hypothetical protein
MSDAITETYYADATAAKRYGLRPSQRYITVSYETEPGRETDDEGQRAVDEIHAVGLSLEMMDESNCWANVAGLRVWFRAYHVRGQREPRLVVTCEPESCAPVAAATAGGGREG